MALERVGKKHPCPICQKEDWCMYGKSIAICMRVSSNKVKEFRDGSIGYIHVTDDSVKPLPYVPLKPAHERQPMNCQALLDEWLHRQGSSSLDYLARTLGVTRKSLELIGCVKSPQRSVWGFPMFDSARVPIGIRLRHEGGQKWSEPGSFNGLFIPDGEHPGTIAIVEGPTDTAAALSIGVWAIGRFNNCGGATMICDFIRRRKVKRAIVVADLDQDRVLNEKVVNPGISGAVRLAELLPIPSVTVTLPAKDMRSFVQKGGNGMVFNSIVKPLVWKQPAMK